MQAIPKTTPLNLKNSPKFADKNQNATLLRGSGNPKSTLKKLVAVGKNLSRIQSSKEHKLANIQILIPLPIESEAINSIHLLFLILKPILLARAIQYVVLK
jgi:hypothetical protein